jgi:MAP/microtubule affinity-regulating kinase
MVTMGYNRKEVEDSITQQKYDDIQATYLLLGRRSLDVCIYQLMVYYFL